MNTKELPSPLSIKDFCRKNNIRKMSLFGSILRSDYRSDSDIDVLVEFEPGHVPGLDFFLMEAELSKLFGKKVDLQTPGFLGNEIYQRILKEAISAYEQA
jgi:uncharacterized protein